ncbi:hypothetical protein M0805_004190 [Coniferiporia weirii]|nr:hypothetical protein M0805_004190 [Coniferiporia weirii]
MSFVRSVCAAMERIAPLRLAESWDNVGLVLEAPFPRPDKRVLLTIDLTPTVAQEAIARSASVVIAYHPPIFRPLSALTLDNPLQASLLRLAASGISVYTPHTALDSVNGGVNDWLAGAFGPKHVPSYLESKDDARGGAGRLLTLPDPGLPVQDVVSSIKRHLGTSGQVQLSVPYAGERNIKTVAICAGAGESMFNNVDADLYFTGEMPHHAILAAKAKGRYVLLCGHTNTERGYLPTLRKTLLESVADDPVLTGLEVEISAEDKHPLQGI